MNTRLHRPLPSSSPSSTAHCLAFTLIELLTVIGIIAILMGLLLPVFGQVKENARRVQAKNDVTQIVVAVKAYYTEYGKYPAVANAPGSGDTIIGKAGNAPSDNAVLFDILRSRNTSYNEEPAGTEYGKNSRRIVFFEGKTVSNTTSPRAGFYDTAPGIGNYFDPWGSQYIIIMDTDYDNLIDVNFYSDFTNTNSPRTGVGAVALGKDKTVGEPTNSIPVNGKYREGTTTSDDVITWQ